MLSGGQRAFECDLIEICMRIIAPCIGIHTLVEVERKVFDQFSMRVLTGMGFRGHAHGDGDDKGAQNEMFP